MVKKMNTHILFTDHANEDISKSCLIICGKDKKVMMLLDTSWKKIILKPNSRSSLTSMQPEPLKLGSMQRYAFYKIISYIQKAENGAPSIPSMEFKNK